MFKYKYFNILMISYNNMKTILIIDKNCKNKL